MEAPAQVPSADHESTDWLTALRADGPARDAAVARLHALLLRAARFEVGRRTANLAHLREHADDLANQSADDALVAVLAKLDTFRGDSRFTTWAYKFAVLEAAVAVRRRQWQGREITLADETWSHAFAAEASPARSAETAELMSVLGEAIRTDLTPRQREVLVALAIDGVPIDVLADRLGSTRNALYKTLHEARKKLRAHLTTRGLHPTDGGPR